MVFNNWQQVLDQMMKYPPKDGNFYMLTQDKGTGQERRSRLLSYAEVLELVIYQVERDKLNEG